MSARAPSPLQQRLQGLARGIGAEKESQSALLLAALFIGLACGLGAVGFYMLLSSFHWLFFGAASERALLDAIAAMPKWQVFAAPVLGGLMVGVLTVFVARLKNPPAIAEVIAVTRVRAGSDRITLRDALYGALISTLALGSGASGGREGPVVHLCAGIASAITAQLGIAGRFNRILIGAGSAAAVGASFNAPIAGIVFAHEVILRHMSIRAMGPIILASVAGTILARSMLGADYTFDLPDYSRTPDFYDHLRWELLIFVGLGLISGGISVLFINMIRCADAVSSRLPVWNWFKPVIGGAVIGAIGIYVPEILGVGYGAVNNTLRGDVYTLVTLVWLVAIKIIATAITMASRFCGGIFSPTVYLGTLTGGAFGLALAQLWPAQADNVSFYAFAGMGAVAAAVLRAPISTTLIVFEMTGDYDMTIALLISTAIANAVNRAALPVGFFEWQLLKHGIDVSQGTYKTAMHSLRVEDIMEPIGAPYPLDDQERPVVFPETSLEGALDQLEDSDSSMIEVVRREDPGTVIAILTYTEAIKELNRHLIAANIEENQ